MIDIKSLLKLGESKEWAIPVIKPLDHMPLGAKRTRAGDAKLKSNVPAACRVRPDYNYVSHEIPN